MSYLIEAQWIEWWIIFGFLANYKAAVQSITIVFFHCIINISGSVLKLDWANTNCCFIVIYSHHDPLGAP